MNRATGKALSIPSEDNASGSWADDIKVHNATYFTAEMLHRTSEADGEPASVWSVDHFALERMARAMRRDHIAQMVYVAQLGVAKAATSVVGAVRAAMTPVTSALAAGLEAAANRAAGWQRKRREAYLSEAADVYDLERRMRDMERRYHRSFG